MWCHCGFHVVVNVVPRGRHHSGTAGSTWHHDAQRCLVCFFTKSRENAQLACPPSVFCQESRTRCMRALQKGSNWHHRGGTADQKSQIGLSVKAETRPNICFVQKISNVRLGLPHT